MVVADQLRERDLRTLLQRLRQRLVLYPPPALMPHHDQLAEAEQRLRMLVERRNLLGETAVR